MDYQARLVATLATLTLYQKQGIWVRNEWLNMSEDSDWDTVDDLLWGNWNVQSFTEWDLDMYIRDMVPGDSSPESQAFLWKRFVEVCRFAEVTIVDV